MRSAVLAAMIVAAAMVALAVSPAAADVLLVTATDDSKAANRPAVPGSLREVLERAQPGDLIVFDVGGPILLRQPLRIASDLTGLTIQGPATIQGVGPGVLEILADNATLQRLTFDEVHVFGGREGGSYRYCRRAHSLRGWTHGPTQQVLP